MNHVKSIEVTTLDVSISEAFRCMAGLNSTVEGMSSSSADVELRLELFWSQCVELASFIILYYDYALTFPDEVEFFWKRSCRAFFAILFYTNRYLSVFGNLPHFLVRFGLEQLSVCKTLELYNQYFVSINQLVISTIFIHRVYAMYAQNFRILCVLVIALAGVIANGLFQWYRSKGAIGTSPDAIMAKVCLSTYTDLQGKHMIFYWLGVVAFDMLVFALTLKKSMQLKATYLGSNLWDVVTRDGILYFGAITLSNGSNILVFAIEEGYMKTLLANLVNIVASVMTSRLMLNLRGASQDLKTSRNTVESLSLPLSTNGAVSLATLWDPECTIAN
ncbi:hypothetical protein D9758_000513 [Tetrapyrgos nigripes]|uniref:DUF6533 domain-containing protein n=1 Tax=Tetrapyrgos nigripes TaxID=182062 RepID=A0A8H5H1D5_9AGAR|nr:hypothetical protein D9758_000513 [Tetrapyrgos nigripes]